MEAIDLGLLVVPSLRSLSYLNAYQTLGYYPKQVILIDSPMKLPKGLYEEDEKYSYSGSYFPADKTINEYLEKWPTEIISVGSTDINSKIVHQALHQYSSDHIVFTGGGILTKETLQQGVKFIHVHPGKLPSYRGSTCFYYSLLEQNTCHATAFFMKETLDTGFIIDDQEFKLTHKIHDDQPLFLDYIYDPFIRAETLKKVLQQYVEKNAFTLQQQEETDKSAYYIMHPVLRHLAIHKHNQTIES